MAVKIVAEATITVGQPVVVEGPSRNGNFGVVFEDDGDTGYFYSLDFSCDDNPIVDAMHIYNAAQVADRHLNFPSAMRRISCPLATCQQTIALCSVFPGRVTPLPGTASRQMTHEIKTVLSGENAGDIISAKEPPIDRRTRPEATSQRVMPAFGPFTMQPASTLPSGENASPRAVKSPSN